MSKIVVALTILVLAANAQAADQTVLGRKVQVKSLRAQRRLLGEGRATSGNDTVVGDPTTAGAVLTFFADGSTTTIQDFFLPASGWRARGTSGFSYKDSKGVNGP